MFTSINKIRDRNATHVLDVNIRVKAARKHPLMVTGRVSPVDGGRSYPSYTLPNGTSVSTANLPVTRLLVPLDCYDTAEEVAAAVLHMENQFLTAHGHPMLRPILMTAHSEYLYDEEDNELYLEVICPDFEAWHAQAIYGDCGRFYSGQDPSTIQLYAPQVLPVERVKFLHNLGTRLTSLDGIDYEVLVTPETLKYKDGTPLYMLQKNNDWGPSHHAVPQIEVETYQVKA